MPDLQEQALACQHRAEKPITGVAARHPPNGPYVPRPYHLLIFFLFERAGGIHQPSSRLERLEGPAQNQLLHLLQLPNTLGAKPPLDLRISRQRAGAGARRIHQNAIEPFAQS